jgi:hypothetical protein
MKYDYMFCTNKDHMAEKLKMNTLEKRTREVGTLRMKRFKN